MANSTINKKTEEPGKLSTEHGNLAMDYLHELLNITRPFFPEIDGESLQTPEHENDSESKPHKWFKQMMDLVVMSDRIDAEVMYVALKASYNDPDLAKHFHTRIYLTNELIGLLALVKKLAKVHDDLNDFSERFTDLLDKFEHIPARMSEPFKVPNVIAFATRSDFAKWAQPKVAQIAELRKELQSLLGDADSYIASIREGTCKRLFERLPGVPGKNNSKHDSVLYDYIKYCSNKNTEINDYIDNLLSIRQSLIDCTGESIWRPDDLIFKHTDLCQNLFQSAEELLKKCEGYDLIHVLVALVVQQ